MNKKFTITCVLALALLPLVNGCLSTSEVNHTPTESVGRQLLDLQQAYKDNIISPEEYEKLRKKLIDKYD